MQLRYPGASVVKDVPSEPEDASSTTVLNITPSSNIKISSIESPPLSTTSSQSIETLLTAIATDQTSDIALSSLKTLAKYLSHIVTYPNDLKYQSINTTNRIFVERIASIPASRQILFFVGFVEACDDSEKEEATGTNSCVEASSRLVMAAPVDMANITHSLDCINKTIAQLQQQSMSATNDAAIKKKATSSSGESAFDPFKSSIVRTAPQVE